MSTFIIILIKQNHIFLSFISFVVVNFWIICIYYILSKDIKYY